jgi:outer membrane lipoprotein-sorting protein
MRSVLLAGAFALAVTTSGYGQTANETIGRAVTAYTPIRTMRGTFEQTLRNTLLGTTATARGEFEQQFPNRIAVRFSDPKGDVLIVDGSVAWLYLPSSNPGQALKVPALASGSSLNIIEQFLRTPQARYTITDAGTALVGGRPTHAVKLVPRTPTREFTEATVWVDDSTALIRQFEVHEPNGLVRRIRIIDTTLNPTIAPRAFIFTPPAGVRVIDQTRGPG